MKLGFVIGLIICWSSLSLSSACRSSGPQENPIELNPGPPPALTDLSTLRPAGPGLGKVKIIVSVDWEGQTLIDDALDDMKKFRQDYPDIPIQHFLNAAYYLKTRADSVKITKQINSVLLPTDELGLHLHSWRSLVLAAKIPFRTSPTYSGRDVDVARDCDRDCGSDVALSSYDEASIRKLIALSVDVLTDHGFKRPVSFRAGGWLADHKVLRALAQEGFSLDSSATYSGYSGSIRALALEALVGTHWPNITPLSQPYEMKFSTGESLIELPNNGSLADYVYPADMLANFKRIAALRDKNPDRHVYLSIGFHQESATYYLQRFRTGLDQIRAYAAENKIPIEFVVPPLQ